MSKSKATIGMTEVLPRFEKAYALIEKSGIKVYVDEEPSNGSSVYRAEQDDVDHYLYLHSQAMDDFRESGYAYFGHDSVSVDSVVKKFNTVKGLHAECDDPETSKILVWASELDSDDCKWVVEEGSEPEMKLWGDILADNSDLTPVEIMDSIKSNSAQAEADLATKH